MKPFGNAALRAQIAMRGQAQPRRLFQGSQNISLLRGTTVLTREGERPAEDIKSGDSLITRTQGMAQVEAVRTRRAMLQAVSIAAGSLGDSRADGDLIVPWDQRILVRDWRAKAMFGQPQAVVPAYELVDGEFIRDLGLQMMDLAVLEFSRPHVIYAGGLELSAAAAPQEDLRPAA
ncbi:Hint domain-containing protein [Leisingera caerulea]|uniref:Hint domain-containing protein n=1 Tax=Leisingera caerulea TaxID=506591 RepID=A0A9Q9M283_LEICA|nr:Hint domain-containing protein [Leisingera caerulea]UWQ55387.1 Hint domain-containing protein [Leisingera caerulea]